MGDVRNLVVRVEIRELGDADPDAVVGEIRGVLSRFRLVGASVDVAQARRGAITAADVAAAAAGPTSIPAESPGPAKP